jgi:hypothetical protein
MKKKNESKTMIMHFEEIRMLISQYHDVISYVTNVHVIHKMNIYKSFN